MSADIVLGIDLGTTYSAMAIVDRFGKPIILPNADGQPTTPSVIHFYHRDACVVGEEAVKMVVVDPTNVVRFIKRSMGEPDFNLEFFGRSYTPQELSAIILRKLKDDAEEALGHEVKDAVITVPAYFNSAQRGATSEAGTLAGLNVLSIINEPTAAAIAFGIERLGQDRRLMVFDLGGGTFDVTLMDIKGTNFRTIASDGNAELGGKDWDDRLVNHVAEQFIDRYGVDPRDDPHRYQELYERCLHAKISLSSRPKAVIPVTYKGNRLVVNVSIEEFEALTTDLVDQCADTCQLVLERAKLSWSRLDEVLLVGGATRMPMIRRRLMSLYGRPASEGINPDEGVALGAALAGVLRHRPKHPGLLASRQALTARSSRARPAAEATPAEPARPSAPAASGLAPVEPRASVPAPTSPPEPASPALGQVTMVDITSHTLGVVALDRELNERIVPIIPAGTVVPCEKGGRFAYAYDGMTAVRVVVTEGDGARRDEVKTVGEVVLDRLPPRPRGTHIEVVYRYGLNQILEVDVIDVETGAVRNARIEIRGGLAADALARAAQNLSRAQVS